MSGVGQSETSRRVHSGGFVGIERAANGATAVVLGMGGARVPVLTVDERLWLAAELRNFDIERIPNG